MLLVVLSNKHMKRMSNELMNKSAKKKEIWIGDISDIDIFFKNEYIKRKFWHDCQEDEEFGINISIAYKKLIACLLRSITNKDDAHSCLKLLLMDQIKHYLSNNANFNNQFHLNELHLENIPDWINKDNLQREFNLLYKLSLKYAVNAADLMFCFNFELDNFKSIDDMRLSNIANNMKYFPSEYYTSPIQIVSTSPYFESTLEFLNQIFTPQTLRLAHGINFIEKHEPDDESLDIDGDLDIGEDCLHSIGNDKEKAYYTAVGAYKIVQYDQMKSDITEVYEIESNYLRTIENHSVLLIDNEKLKRFPKETVSNLIRAIYCHADSQVGIPNGMSTHMEKILTKKITGTAENTFIQRAIGLYLYDQYDCLGKKKTLKSILDELSKIIPKSSKFSSVKDTNNKKDFERYLKNTRDCITYQQILPFTNVPN